MVDITALRVRYDVIRGPDGTLIRRDYHRHRAGGPSLAAELAAAGMRTAVIERHRFGGHLRQRRLHPDQGRWWPAPAPPTSPAAPPISGW